jgi:epoxyqueuosine reductase
LNIVAFAQAKRLDDDARRLEQWLSSNMHGDMKYMENHFELRVNPSLLVPGAKICYYAIKELLPRQTTGSKCS